MQRIHTLLRSNDSRTQQLLLDQFFKVHIFRYLEISRIEIQIRSTTTNNRTSWVVCRGKKRYVEELRLNDPGHNPTSSELLEHKGMERSVAKENLVRQRWSHHGASRKPMRSSWKFRRIQCTILQKMLLLLKKGSGLTLMLVNNFGHEIGTPL